MLDRQENSQSCSAQDITEAESILERFYKESISSLQARHACAHGLVPEGGGSRRCRGRGRRCHRSREKKSPAMESVMAAPTLRKRRGRSLRPPPPLQSPALGISLSLDLPCQEHLNPAACERQTQGEPNQLLKCLRIAKKVANKFLILVIRT